VLFAFVLCSVTDVDAVLAETRRVTREGAAIGVIEHVRGQDGSWMRRAQRVLAPLWPRFTGGCHADRDTRAALAAAGFPTDSLRDTQLTSVPPVAPTLLGTMVR
jgi:ubiquinone/menaquinone biosynthesis C-methylase UbiE